MDETEKKLLTTTVGVKGNVRAITIADFEVDEHLPDVLDIVERFYDFYAWILHDKDEGVPEHYHLLAIQKGGTTLKNHCDYFASVLPSNFICKVKSPRSMAKYMIHKGYHGKHQYLVDEVFTNDKARYVSMLDTYVNSGNVFRDYRSCLEGKMTFEQFISTYESEFSTMPFYQKLSIYHRILNAQSGATQVVFTRPPKDYSGVVKRRTEQPLN